MLIGMWKPRQSAYLEIASAEERSSELRMNMNDVANEVMFEHITEMKVMEQAMWAQGKSTVRT